ncbi:MAG: CotH kinase family protein [Myxococcales bacterium]|nr:CotH kinase family protein [Myxococcales bacterium]
MCRRALAIVAVLAACGSGGGDLGDGGAPGDGATTGDGAITPVGQAVFDPSVLHTLELVVAPDQLATLDDDASIARVPATLVFDGTTVAQVGLRKKGTSSRRPLSGKSGFTVKLNAFVPGQRLDGLEKLVIDNAIEDPSLLVGHLAYEVYRRAGLPAPRTAHATVRFNGVDKGLFVLEEATDSAYLEAQFGDGTGNVYEGPWDFPRGAAAAELRDEVIDGRSRADLEALTAVVMDTPDGQLAAALDAHLDVDRFLTNYAVEMAAALWDNYAIVAWNFYLYHVPGGRFVMLTHGVNWPYWHADMDPFDLHTDPWNASAPPGYLCDRVNQIPALAARYRAELERVTTAAFDVATLEARIDQVEAALHARPLTGASLENLGRFEGAVVDARAFVRARKAYLTTRLGL